MTGGSNSKGIGVKKEKTIVIAAVILALAFLLLATHTVEINVNFEKTPVPMPKCSNYYQARDSCNLYGGLAQVIPNPLNTSCLTVSCTVSQEVYQKMRNGTNPNATIFNLVVK